MPSKWAPLALTCLAGFSGAAAAQTPDQRPCFSPDPVVAIRGCTAIIDMGQETPEDLTKARFSRGVAYLGTGQIDRAIADFDQAIALNPNEPTGFNNRGVAYAEKGQYDRAIADYDEAVRLSPNFPQALSNRGVVYTGTGRYDRA